MNFSKSQEWLRRARKVIPSASQTYSKGYRYYCEGAAPALIDRGRGAHVWDVDGNEFVDTVMGLGAVTVGYCDPRVDRVIENQLKKGISFSQATVLETMLAEKLVSILPCAEQVRFVKNGSDATTAAIRLARAYTGRDVVLSCGYHGWHDWSIGKTQNNRGVPVAVQNLTAKFRYNDLEDFERLLKDHRGKIAAVILEPVELEPPKKDFLETLRRLTQKEGIVLVFDEVVTGFRCHLSGAQAYFGVTPDLAAFGKGMANGAALSCVAGKKEIMNLIDEGAFISMTFGGETLALAAALETISILSEPNAYPYLWQIQEQWAKGIRELIAAHALEKTATVTQFPAIPALLFNDFSPSVSGLDIQSYFQQEVLKEGVLYLGPHNFCLAHTEADIRAVLGAYEIGLKKVPQALKKNNLSALLQGEKIRPVFQRRNP